MGYREDQVAFECALRPQLESIANSDAPLEEMVVEMIYTAEELDENYNYEYSSAREISGVLFGLMAGDSSVRAHDVENLRATTYANRRDKHGFPRPDRPHRIGQKATNYALASFAARQASPNHTLFKRHGINR